jgi:hypothetical protein
VQPLSGIGSVVADGFSQFSQTLDSLAKGARTHDLLGNGYCLFQSQPGFAVKFLNGALHHYAEPAPNPSGIGALEPQYIYPDSAVTPQAEQ